MFSMTKKIIFGFLFFVLLSASCFSQVIEPTPRQVEWANSEIGVLIHYDMQVYESSYDWRKDFNYHPSTKIFNPDKLNTDQWIQAAKNAGATYAVLVAKHCSGFSLWPTKAHEYSVKNSPWKNGKGDIVADFIASLFHEVGLSNHVIAKYQTISTACFKQRCIVHIENIIFYPDVTMHKMPLLQLLILRGNGNDKIIRCLVITTIVKHIIANQNVLHPPGLKPGITVIGN